MARTDNKPDDRVLYSGEVWTDARGYATVALPSSVGSLHANLQYELRPFERGVIASLAAELVDGRFTIATDQPHVKVAWRVLTQRAPKKPTRSKEER
jgi:hypothetical protein